jgi:hypothetical protein
VLFERGSLKDDGILDAHAGCYAYTGADSDIGTDFGGRVDGGGRVDIGRSEYSRGGLGEELGVSLLEAGQVKGGSRDGGTNVSGENA